MRLCYFHFIIAVALCWDEVSICDFQDRVSAISDGIRQKPERQVTHKFLFYKNI